jgi:beta-lactam-binding protein with PASTA domain
VVFGLHTNTPQCAGPDAKVTAQSPPAGTALKPRAVMTVTVAPPFATVPPLVGLSLAEARAALAKAELRLALRGGDAERGGAITEQTPAAGAHVPLQSTVTVGLGVAYVEVPDIVHATLADARRRVAQAVLQLRLSGDDAGAGATALVAAQEPPAHRRVKPQSMVTATLALPSPSSQPTPNPQPNDGAAAAGSNGSGTADQTASINNTSIQRLGPPAQTAPDAPTPSAVAAPPADAPRGATSIVPPSPPQPRSPSPRQEPTTSSGGDRATTPSPVTDGPGVVAVPAPVTTGALALAPLLLLLWAGRRWWRRRQLRRPLPVRVTLTRDAGRPRVVARRGSPPPAIIGLRVGASPTVTTIRKVA